MLTKKLPVGIDSFEKLRREVFCYGAQDEQ